VSLQDSFDLNAEGYCRKCNAPLGISGQCASCAIEEYEQAHQSEEDILRAQLRKISWIVRKPRTMSRYLNETELLRAIVEEVRATFTPTIT
jgi:hypothetical protein